MNARVYLLKDRVAGGNDSFSVVNLSLLVGAQFGNVVTLRIRAGFQSQTECPIERSERAAVERNNTSAYIRPPNHHPEWLPVQTLQLFERAAHPDAARCPPAARWAGSAREKLGTADIDDPRLGSYITAPDDL